MRTPNIRHLRYRKLKHTRHSRLFLAWLAAQADRLETTVPAVFDSLIGASAVEVEAIPTPTP